MNKPDILGVEVLTPDGLGSILSLDNKKVTVHLHKREYMQVMRGIKKDELHYAYNYEDVHIIKGQYCFDEKQIQYQYEGVFDKKEPVESPSLHLFGKPYKTNLDLDTLKVLKKLNRPNKL